MTITANLLRIQGFFQGNFLKEAMCIKLAKLSSKTALCTSFYHAPPYNALTLSFLHAFQCSETQRLHDGSIADDASRNHTPLHRR